jgi:hypothetical protein
MDEINAKFYLLLNRTIVVGVLSLGYSKGNNKQEFFRHNGG